MKKIILLAICLCLGVASWCQDNPVPKEPRALVDYQLRARQDLKQLKEQHDLGSFELSWAIYTRLFDEYGYMAEKDGQILKLLSDYQKFTNATDAQLRLFEQSGNARRLCIDISNEIHRLAGISTEKLNKEMEEYRQERKQLRMYRYIHQSIRSLRMV